MSFLCWRCEIGHCIPSMHVGVANGTPEQQVCPFWQTFAPQSSSGGTGGQLVIFQPHVPPLSTQVGPAVDPSQQIWEGAPGIGPGQAPFAEQSSFGGTGAGGGVVGPGAGVGAGHERISQWHAVAFVLMQRPVLPPVEPSEQRRAARPSAGPQSAAAQTLSSDESVSVGLSVRSLPPDVPEHAATPAARGARASSAKQKVRAFIGVASV